MITARELVIALVILLVLLFAGTAILDFLGLTQPSLNIAGGVLLFIIALRMIFPQRGPRVANADGRAVHRAARDADGGGSVDDRDPVAAELDGARADLGMVHGAS